MNGVIDECWDNDWTKND